MIRPATINDLETIVKLEEKVLKTTLGLSFLNQEFSNPDLSILLVCQLDQQIIGYLSIRITGTNAELYNFLIDTPYQNKGFGEKLLNHALDLLKEKEVTSLILEVRQSNTKAINFYIKHGFSQILIRKNYYQNEDGLVLIKEVK